MTGLLITADQRGNVIATITITAADDAVHVEAAGADLVLQVAADEAVQVHLVGPGPVLVDVLADALAAVLVHVDGPQ